MMTAPHLEMIRTSLRDKMLAQLAMRWEEANAYIPPGSVIVHCAKPPPEAEQARFDLFVLAYQAAIEDILDMLDKASDKPERPHALVMAEASVFQGGALPRQAIGRGKPKGPAKSRGRRPFSAARQRAEDLFGGGGNG